MIHTEDLVSAAQNGCKEAENELIKRCQPIAKRLAQRAWNDKPSWGPMRPSADYDDRCQEALIAIWRQALPKFDKDHKSRASFETTAWWWGYSGARLWTKKRTRHDRKIRSDVEQILHPLDVMREHLRRQCDEAYEAVELREDLFSKLRKLPQEEQRLLFYRFWVGMNVRQIETLSRGKRSGLRRMSRQTVLDIQNKALARLRGMLEGA